MNTKVILLTGASTGIGKICSTYLASQGHIVYGTSRNGPFPPEKMQKNQPILIQLDVNNPSSINQTLKYIIQENKVIDVVINNAGIIQPFVHLKDLKFEQIDKLMNVNFYGTLYMTKAFLNHLLTRPEAHIVNIASMGGFFPVPGQSAYGASKAAVKLMTEGLYSELSDTGVHVSVVFPGGIATDIMKNSKVTDKSASEKEKNSKLLLSETYLYVSEKASFIASSCK